MTRSALILALLLGATSYAERYAVLVGVEDYEHADLRSPQLEYSVDDATELAEVLRGYGYRVVVLTDDTGASDPRLKPTRGNIDKAVRQAVGKCQRDDTLLVGLAGHGLQFAGEKEAYFCPIDARPFQRDRESLVSIKSLYDSMESSFAGAKFVLVDACRNDPDPSRGRDALSPDTVPPPRGVGVLFSCSPGERAFENEELKHGIFFYHVIQRLRSGGPAGVGYYDLSGHLGSQVTQTSLRLAGLPQTFNQQGNVYGAPLIVPPRPAEADDPPRELTNSLGMQLRLIPAGEFWMGSTDSQVAAAKRVYAEGNYSDEQPRHLVRLTKDFYLGAHEVTKGQFAEFMRESGYQTEAEKDGKGGLGWYDPTEDPFSGEEEKARFEQSARFSWRETGFPYEDDHPVVNVTWNDAVVFCEWLSKKEGQTYRLPTEAEWEYACRAGSEGLWSFGDDERALTRHANVADATAKAKFSEWTTASGRDGHVFTASAKSFPANGWGMFDLHGNAWEWCADWYGAKYFESGGRTDPAGPPNGEYRVLRGGGFVDNPAYARSAARGSGVAPGDRNYVVGFRVARTK